LVNGLAFEIWLTVELGVIDYWVELFLRKKDARHSVSTSEELAGYTFLSLHVD
jgi:hypothetical protein